VLGLICLQEFLSGSASPRIGSSGSWSPGLPWEPGVLLEIPWRMSSIRATRSNSRDSISGGSDQGQGLGKKHAIQVVAVFLVLDLEFGRPNRSESSGRVVQGAKAVAFHGWSADISDDDLKDQPSSRLRDSRSWVGSGPTNWMGWKPFFRTPFHAPETDLAQDSGSEPFLKP
jgi:hypothetical protein